jgi:hypothetical protein
MQSSLNFPLSSPPPYSGSQLTSGLNGAFWAVATAFSSGAAPTTGTTGLSSNAGLFWHDLSTGNFNARNQADNAWLFCGRFDETNGLYNSAAEILNVTTTTTVSGYTILASDNIVEVNASGAVSGFYITHPLSLYVSGKAIKRRIEKVDTTGNPVYITTDGTSGTIVDAITTAATASGQINGWRDVYSNGTNIRSLGVG